MYMYNIQDKSSVYLNYTEIKKLFIYYNNLMRSEKLHFTDHCVSDHLKTSLSRSLISRRHGCLEKVTDRISETLLVNDG